MSHNNPSNNGQNDDPMAPNPIMAPSSSFLHSNPASSSIVPDPMILSSSTTTTSDTQQQSHAAVAVPNPILVADTQQQQTAAAAAEANNKRTALAGQWRTPPTPFFPSNETEETVPALAPMVAPPSQAATTTIATVPSTTTTTAASQLPNSAEDYAKALQEAYRRGAEAAALAAQQRLATVASCPDLVVQPVAVQLPPAQTALPQQQQHILAPVHANATSSAISSNTTDITMTNATTAAAAQQVTGLQPPKKSASLPDMASYAAAAEAEKRKKRLARNRASARLRRLRKKNLVDAYETEVGVLETALGHLERHAWGTGLSTSALVASLSMDRGQQPLTPTERCAAATELLEQQLRYLDFLQGILEEQRVLQQVAAGTFDDGELDLQLTPDQRQAILAQASGFEDEWNALQTVKSSLHAMKENEWLWNEGCGAVAEQFMAVLHKNQVAKFLQWCDHNAEAIEELDAVHAVHTVAESPVFSFGMDSNPNELLED